jgi:multiple sugar transport system permease protein
LSSITVTSTAPGPSRARRWLSGFRDRETWTAYLFLFPWIFGFLVFTLGPMIFSLYYSLSNYGLQQIAGLEPTKYVGLKNYRQLLDDPKIGESLKNTFVYTVMMVPGKIIVALLLAMLLMRVKRFAGFFRTVFYLPHMTPAVAVGVLLLFLFNGQVGIVNHVLHWIGIQGPYWTVDPSWIKPTIALMDIWACGGTMVILLAALHGVPRHLYEAAEMDGAPAWRRFTDVTLPMISPALFFCFIILTLAGLQQFTQTYTAFFGAAGIGGGGGGAGGGSGPEAALMFSIYLFRQAFQYFDMGFASAMAWLLFVISMAITLVNILVTRRFVFYQGSSR